MDKAFNATGTKMAIYPASGDGTYAQKGAALAGVFAEVYDITPPSPDLSGIDVSHMESTDREYVDRVLPEFGELAVEQALNVKINPEVFKGNKYWVSILWPVANPDAPGQFWRWDIKVKLMSWPTNIAMEEGARVTTTWTALTIADINSAAALDA